MSPALQEYRRRLGASPLGRLVDDARALVFFIRMVRDHARHIGFHHGCAFCDLRSPR